MNETSLSTARPEPFDSSLILSWSKDERFAQDRPVEGRARHGSWFDKLTTSVCVCACVLIMAGSASAAALDVQVKEVRAAASAVRTAVELRNIVPERFKKMIDDGAVLHLRVQAELWESRPVWDRLVYPAIVKVFRLGRSASSRDLAITDAAGATTSYAILPNMLPMLVDLGETNRVTESQKYYVHVVATLGTLAEKDVDEVGDAVFGREGETNGLGSLGRMVFRTALKVSDYLQSVSAEAKSRRIDGRDIIRP